jgi:hypothetical protein
MDRESCPRISNYFLTINHVVPEEGSRALETAEHRFHVEDPQICDHPMEGGSTENETSSDDEFFDCPQPEGAPGVVELTPSSVNQPPGPPETDSEKVADPEPRSLTPNPVETLPQRGRMYRLLNLVTERGTGGISEWDT